MTDKKDIIIDTDAIEIVFDTNIRHIATPTFRQAEQIADSIIAKTRELQDPYYAFEALRQFDTLRNLVGIAKAKVLHFLNKYWVEFQIQTPFLETISAYSGLSNTEVIKRYIKIWDMFENGSVPEQFIDGLKAKPINELTPIMGALQAGYKLDEDNWEQVSELRGNHAISNYLRENVKKTEPRVQAIVYTLDKIDGMLYATTNGTRHRIGRLVLTGQEEQGKRAIARLIENMHIYIINEEEE